MKIKINRKEKVVFFEVGFPTCLGVPHIMKKHFPEFSHQVLPHKEFQRIDFPVLKEVVSR